MDSDQGKLFIGGISWDTSEEKLTEYFSNYGEVVQTSVMKDKITGKPRGFGFVAFADPSILDTVLQDTHIIDGRTVIFLILDHVFIIKFHSFVDLLSECLYLSLVL